MVSMGPCTDCPPAGDAGWRDHDLMFQSSLHLLPPAIRHHLPIGGATWQRNRRFRHHFALSTGLCGCPTGLCCKFGGAVIVGNAAAGFCVNFFTARRLLHNPIRRSRNRAASRVRLVADGISTAVVGSRLAGVMGGTRPPTGLRGRI